MNFLNNLKRKDDSSCDEEEDENEQQVQNNNNNNNNNNKNNNNLENQLSSLNIKDESFEELEDANAFNQLQQRQDPDINIELIKPKYQKQYKKFHQKAEPNFKNIVILKKPEQKEPFQIEEDSQQQQFDEIKHYDNLKGKDQKPKNRRYPKNKMQYVAKQTNHEISQNQNIIQNDYQNETDELQKKTLKQDFYSQNEFYPNHNHRKIPQHKKPKNRHYNQQQQQPDYQRNQQFLQSQSQDYNNDDDDESKQFKFNSQPQIIYKKKLNINAEVFDNPLFIPLK